MKGAQRLVARAILRAAGWRAEGTPPGHERFVMAIAPHTSNWDTVYLVLLGFAHSLAFVFPVKASLFRGPLGLVLRLVGAFPVERGASKQVVDRLVELFRERDRIILAITPEGTRARAARWRAGFYLIAQAAGVPIVLGYVDYRRRAVGFGPEIWPSGDLEGDLARMANFFAGVTARYPENVGPVSVIKPKRLKGVGA